jgi:hypothetical protein
MSPEIAAGQLLDEDSDGVTHAVAEDADARQRVQSYLMRTGMVRPDPETTWAFGRRQVDEGYLVADLGGRDREEPATVCLLAAEGVLAVDRGGPLLENDVVSALLGGYYDQHGGSFQLHAEPFPDEAAVADARDSLTEAGLVDDGEGRGPFADALTRLADGLDARLEDHLDA